MSVQLQKGKFKAVNCFKMIMMFKMFKMPSNMHGSRDAIASGKSINKDIE